MRESTELSLEEARAIQLSRAAVLIQKMVRMCV